MRRRWRRWPIRASLPIPELILDPNEGVTYGLLPVLMLTDRDGRLEHMIADDVRYNRTTGVFPGFRLFGYPTVTLEQMIHWVAQWIRQGGRLLNKPTHYEARSGRY